MPDRVIPWLNILLFPYSHAEKKIKQMDKAIAEWKSKADGVSLELNNTQKECRNASAELFR